MSTLDGEACKFSIAPIIQPYHIPEE